LRPAQSGQNGELNHRGRSFLRPLLKDQPLSSFHYVGRLRAVRAIEFTRRAQPRAGFGRRRRCPRYRITSASAWSEECLEDLVSHPRSRGRTGQQLPTPRGACPCVPLGIAGAGHVGKVIPGRHSHNRSFSLILIIAHEKGLRGRPRTSAGRSSRPGSRPRTRDQKAYGRRVPPGREKHGIGPTPTPTRTRRPGTGSDQISARSSAWGGPP
jgi:hypothetical protein